MSVQVAVRVRPFNSRELKENPTLCVDMIGNQTILINGDKTRPFTYDYSFWSHDEFTEQENGYLKPSGDKYADQQLVYDKIGTDVLNNAFDGYNVCLFAYGQTGAGKSYSMVGYGVNKGIVPIACDEIFKTISKNKNPNLEHEVTLSMIEIYNEKVQDLLIPQSERTKSGLNIREHKIYGFFVDGLKRFPVDSYEMIEHYIDIGTQNRTVESTKMNATSSRAHTIILIEFKQILELDGTKTEKNSVIYLVDLAGSERQSKTEASGDRLKEGSNINKSLTILGRVISALADNESSKKKQKVPFRDSSLTKILSNSLGGNSKTYMICAISPSADNYEETLSTLRYADQAKKIKCKAVVNESQTDKMIRELKEENEKLKQLFTKLQAGEMPENITSLLDSQTDPEAKGAKSSRKKSAQSSDSEKEDLLRKLRETEEALKANEVITKELKTSFKERMVEGKKVETYFLEHQVDRSKPHVSNINEDPILTGKILHGFEEKDEIHVGRRNGDPKPQIIISAIGIQANHARFFKNTEGIFLEPMAPDCSDGIRLNGEKISEAKRLFHLDRIVFGTGTAFLFKDPDLADFKRSGVEEKEIDLEYCQNEINKVEQLDDFLKDMEEEDETQKKLEESQKKFEVYEEQIKQAKIKFENAKMEQERMEREKEYKEMELEFEKKKLQRDYEMERMKQEMLITEQKKLNKEKERRVLEEKLSKYVPLITEVNLIAKELKRNIVLEPYLTYYFTENNDFKENDQQKLRKFKVKVNNFEVGYSYVWDLNRFHNRYYIIKEILDLYFETSDFPKITKDDDPFWDPPEPQLIGQGFLKLMSLAYLLDNPSQLVLVGDHGKVGHINVNLLPADDSGNIIDSDALIEDEIIEDYRELIGRRLDFVVQIDDGELPDTKCSNVFCRYTIKFDTEEQEFRTETLTGNHPYPMFNYSAHHFFSSVSEQTLGYLLSTNLCIEVYGNEENPQPLLDIDEDSFGENNENEEEVSDEGGKATPVQNMKENSKDDELKQFSFPGNIDTASLSKIPKQSPIPNVEKLPPNNQNRGRSMTTQPPSMNSPPGKKEKKKGKDGKDCILI